MKSKVKKTVKNHCETIWISHYNIVEVSQENLDEIIYCLEHLEYGEFFQLNEIGCKMASPVVTTNYI